MMQEAGDPGLIEDPSVVIRRLWDIEMIKQLKARYFRFLDSRDWMALRTVFTEDCTFEAPGMPKVRGGEAFVARAAGLFAHAVTVHHGHMPEIIVVDGALPDMTSVEFIRRVRGINGPVKPQIAVCLTEVDIPAIMRAKRAGAQGYLLNGQERLSLLDWWANALDRSAQSRPADRRTREFDRLMERMEEEVARDPANPVANYWLAAAARGAGDIERAWDLAVAAWVRSSLWPESAPKAREDLDRLVVQVIVPERVRARGAREPQEASKALLDEWAAIKEQWRVPPPTQP